MNIVVAIKHIPSIADDLPVKGNNVDFDSVDFVLNEFDEQSIEQAVLVKEAVGGTVTVVGVDMIGELDNVLHLALAKGADKAVKVTGDDPAADSHQQAKWLAEAIKGMAADIVFAGVQASNDLDGQVGAMIAAYLDMPYIGGVSSVEVSGGTATVNKEFAGGVGAKYEVTLPMVVGVQASVKPPRYAPVSKVRQIAQTATIDKVAPSGEASAGLAFKKMAPPVATGHAEMFSGSSKEVAAKIVELLKSKGLA
ncbi:electron transfer flavoprotein subunit beta [Chloroflexi bacterium CFX5]|nr:electron transfer flavoprotein subunit beta [Chloroflexi bacterium CFX5]NUQ60397.1 electron transfer flavoprotein subunit beta [Anaerolineales bacterium]